MRISDWSSDVCSSDLPLRERGGDVGLIARMLVDRFSPIYGKQVPGFTDRALWTLEAYEWPGNVRELEHVVERAVLLVDDGPRIGTEHLPSELMKAQDASIGVSRGGYFVSSERRRVGKEGVSKVQC